MQARTHRLAACPACVRVTLGESSMDHPGNTSDALRRFVTDAPVAVAMFDREMTYLACSPRWHSDFGFEPGSLVGRCHYDVFPEIPERWKAIHVRCFAGATERAEEDRFERADGREQWLRWEVRPWRHPDGTVAGIIVYSEDITPRKLAESSLARREQEFRLLFDGIQDYALTLLDADGIVRTWNEGAERLLGFAAHEIIGKHLGTIYGGDAGARAQAERDLATAVTSGAVEDEGWRERRDGSQFWGNGSLRPLYADGRHCGFAKILRDTTERHRSTLMLQAVLDCAADAIISIDESGTIQAFNRSGQRMFGHAPQEVIGRNVSMLMPEPDASAHTGYLHRYLATGEARIIGSGREAQGLRRDGTKFPIALSVDQFRIGDRRYFAGIVRDLTERNALEGQLRQAQKMEAVGRLAGGVAHDFNNLLSVILSHAELLLLSPSLDPSARDDLSEIAKAGQRAAQLTRQLLLFSRRTVVQFVRLDVNAVVTDLSRMLQRLLPEHIDFTTELAPDPAPLEADRGMLEQLIMNLVVNARDAMPGGGALRLRTWTTSLAPRHGCPNPGARHGHCVAIEVEDDGVGMDDATREHIFEPFFTTKPAGEGTGLGLSTVFGIVHQFGGCIVVASAPGEGARFTVYLPIVEGATVVAAPATARASGGRAETILVVEDDAAVRAVACNILRRAGYEVIAANGGADALALAARHAGRIALVLTDVVMPGMNGYALVAALRRDHPRLRALVMSGYIDDAARAQEAEAGSLPFVAKPFTPEALASKVRAVLDEA
ncbi:MAG: PAS domain S-box protein [Nannocystaceae bacterium]|nr:PAS domain S-box protein [Nannocystaceae bacterium]